MENLLSYIIFLKLQTRKRNIVKNILLQGFASLQNTEVNYIGLTENGNWYLKRYSNEGISNAVFKQQQTEMLNRIIQSINNAGGSIIMGEP